MKKITSALTYLVLMFMTVIVAVPFLWMIGTSFKPQKQTFNYPPEWIPKPFTLDNFSRVWQEMPFGHFIWNTVFVTLVILVGQLLFSSMAAYSFSRLNYPGRETIFLIFIGSLMIPEIVTMIPQYLIMKQLSWLDTYKAIIVPQMFGNAFGVFMLRQYLLGIPKELDDAAKIDGSGIVRTFTTMILPLSKPILSTLAVFVLVKSWNNFLWPLVVTTSPKKYVLTIGLANLNGQYTADWSAIMAASFMALLPIIVLFVFFQRYFIQSIQMSGMK
ncbi:carbohydrate ABC transporter permease [Paenibacillus thalictri]|uniref:Carbohydrate ABC transporter permease n=1 Tax=Paenibacillus thalictri TaxID=2527873 RepID=A0A4Q9DR49_9BACL|nr:carbohydrate ABC transporter permease [Paenibacillus thalictri]TBL79079.1 carbohydrate ABC transporter permease [Paenibacillus thalictri]